MRCRFVRDFRRSEKAIAGRTRPNPAGQPGFEKAKSRLAALGHLDPDLPLKMEQLRLASPTVSPTSVPLVLQTCASSRFPISLADIRTAFLNSEELPADRVPVYCELPPGGLPDVEPGSSLLVRKPSYGFNDAPEAWRLRLDKALQSPGWRPTPQDPCCYTGGRVEIQSQKCNLVQWAMSITTWFGKATSTSASGGSEKEVKDFKSILASFG